jgi:flavin reductase (DIM6/NTAB) family NADH-FMN oxidoreductase RutF
MGRLATGVTVVACGDPDAPCAMTANSVTSVSLDPALLLVCVRNQSRWLPQLRACGNFSVNVLRADQQDISQYFAGQPCHTPQLDWQQLEGVPVIGGAAASFACSVAAMHSAGDHTIVIGRVLAMQDSPAATEALIYLRGQYRSLPFAASQHESLGARR